MLTLTKDISQDMRSKKFAVVAGDDFKLAGNFSEFIRLTESWECMGPDPYFGQQEAGNRYRRYSDFNYNAATGELTQLEHRAYVQSKEHNSYVGDKIRHFEDFSREVIDSPVIRSLIDLDFAVYKSVLPEELHDDVWQCQIHQIRIEIKPGKTLEITPEGIHCDGYPFSGVHFWGKENVAGAESQIFSSDRQLLAAATYEGILDTTFFLDREMLHYVTPAATLDSEKPAYRQIIAISFSKPGTAYDTIR